MVEIKGLWLGLVNRYRINRLLTAAEKEKKLRKKVPLKVTSNHALGVVKMNSTYLETVNKYYIWKGKLTCVAVFLGYSAYIVMMIGSVGLPPSAEVKEMGGLADSMRVTPFLLFGTYIILTIAELFISPLGISFVSKVAPPQYQGIMQGCWLGATAVGNQLVLLGAIFYDSIPIWATWCVFVVACLISMTVMFSLLKWLDRVTK